MQSQKKSNSLSIAGFVCSLCGFITCGLTSLIGLILSTIGLSNSKKEGHSDGLAIAGIIIGALPLLFGLMIVFLGVVSPSSTDKNDDNIEVTEKSNQKEKTKTPEKTYTPVNIDDLENALDNNAAAAKDTYNGKYLEITGRLGVIDSDLKYISLLSQTNEWDIIGVHCRIKNNETKEAVKSLTKDQTIIVRGKITDVGEVLGYYLDIDEIIPQ